MFSSAFMSCSEKEQLHDHHCISSALNLSLQNHGLSIQDVNQKDGDNEFRGRKNKKERKGKEKREE